LGLGRPKIFHEVKDMLSKDERNMIKLTWSTGGTNYIGEDIEATILSIKRNEAELEIKALIDISVNGKNFISRLKMKKLVRV